MFDPKPLTNARLSGPVRTVSGVSPTITGSARGRWSAVPMTRPDLVQGAECEFPFRLHTGGSGGPATCGPVDGVLQQRRLTDARVSAHDERAALPGLDVRDKLVE